MHLAKVRLFYYFVKLVREEEDGEEEKLALVKASWFSSNKSSKVS